MSKIGMIWAFAGPELCELIHPLGDASSVEVIRAVQSKCAVSIGDVLQMLKLEATTVH
jgi:hypothetical protein